MIFKKYALNFTVSDEDFKNFAYIIILALGSYSIPNMVLNANEDITQKTLSALILSFYGLLLLLLVLWILFSRRRTVIKRLICFLVVVLIVLANENIVAGEWILQFPLQEVRLASFVAGLCLGILLWQTIKYLGHWILKCLLFSACIIVFAARLVDSNGHRQLYLIPFLLLIALATFLLYSDQQLSGKEYKGFQNQRTLKKRWKEFVKCSMPLPLLILDTNLRVRFYNESFKTTFGLQGYKNPQSNAQILEILNNTFVDRNSMPTFPGLNASPRAKPTEELHLDTYSPLNPKLDSTNSFALKELLTLQEVKNFSFQEGIKLSHCKIYDKQANAGDCLEYEIRLNAINWKNDNCFLIMLQDTSIMLLNEKLKQINMYKDVLLATVSHDLRTPLNGMLNILDIIEADVTAEHKSLLKICRDSGDLLLLMINDILDFSQIQNQKLKLNFTTAITRKIVTEVVDLVRFQAEKKGVQLKTELGDDIPMQVYTDPVRLKQILLNLLTNALKFTKEGYIKVSAQVEYFKSVKQLKFDVEDTGIGIKEDDKEKLFKLFGKIEQKNPEINKNGIGLGLKICQDLVEMLNPLENNKFEVASKYGKGTIFTFRINCENMRDSSRMLLDSRSTPSIKLMDSPMSLKASRKYTRRTSTNYFVQEFPRSLTAADEDNEEKKLPIFRTNNKTVLDQVRPRVLVVDDTAYNVVALTSLLETLKVECYSAFDGEQAIKKLTEEKIPCDLIFMDCNMPGMDGFETALHLRKLMEQNLVKVMPIIAVTGYTLPEEHQRCLESGMNKVLVKPLRKALLKEVLEEFGLIRNEAGILTT